MNVKRFFSVGVFFLVFSSIVLGQATLSMPYTTTVLSVNTDLVNKLVLIEFANIPLAPSDECANYSLRFGLKHNESDLGYQPIKVINNPAMYTDKNVAEQYIYNQSELDGGPGVLVKRTAVFNALPAASLRMNDTLIYDMKLPSYHIAIDLPKNTTPTDTFRVSVTAELYSTVCKACGVHGTNRFFDPEVDINAACPNRGADFQACYKRDSKEANWEAWILDRRDCRFYRVVQMPDDRWWFGQNLNYQGNAEKTMFWQPNASSYAAVIGTTPLERMRSYYCPSGPSLPASGIISAPSSSAENTFQSDMFTSTLTACETYGALYPQRVAVTEDGYALSANDASRPSDLPSYTNMVATSTHRGVCPEGWVVPSRFDWGKMFNLVEYKGGNGCPNNGTNGSSPCKHIMNVATDTIAYSSLFRDLKGTSTAPNVTLTGSKVNYSGITPSWTYPNTTQVASSDTNAVWSYFERDNAGQDRYGFSILPAGWSHYNDVAGNGIFRSRGLQAAFAATNTSSTDNANPTRDLLYITTIYNSVDAVFSGRYAQKMSSSFNVSVRCVKK
ncbi:MAG: hypothetical protein ACRC9X_00175 [Bacteroidales bacterium]